CQINPFLTFPSNTRSTILLAPSYCWKRGKILISCFLLLVLNRLKFLSISNNRDGFRRSFISLETSPIPRNLLTRSSSRSIRQGPQNCNGVRIPPYPKDFPSVAKLRILGTNNCGIEFS